MNPFFNVIVRAGQRIGLIPPGKMMGRAKGNQIISTCNAFLNLRAVMTDADDAKFTIGESSAVLEIPRSSGSGGDGDARYRGNYDFTATYRSGDIVRVTQTLDGHVLAIPWGCVASSDITGIAPVEGANWHCLIGAATWRKWKVCDDAGTVKQAYFISTAMETYVP